ncbi:sodium:solute symporter family protein [Sporomusa sp.]|uniref:sodium:solute symporter family protein n=1 Tax=Sporomusa sp. TaxID=2078658 RepID=UPI002C47075C|nr:sodium:solute symporter family protein [Sporomusa sp.]HWR42905.1 sodium:solute symporter family protein [Sporomusa sp.]
MNFSSVHLFGFLATIIIVFAIGIYSARRVKSAESFTLGGRSAGPAIVSGTIAGTIIGGAATIGTTQLAYSAGLSAWWFTLGSGIGFLVMGIFYASPLRNTGLETISQYLVLNYGRPMGPLTSVISSVGIFFSIVASSLSGIHLLTTLFGFASWQAAVVTVFLVAAYVFWGGMQGTGLSGLMKVAIIYVTLFSAGWCAFQSLQQLPSLETAFPSPTWFSLFGADVWGGLGNVFSLVVGIVCTQTYIQAIFAARDSQTALIGTCTAAVITIPVGLPSVAVGMFMRVNYPDILPIDALPMYMLNHMPAWFGGIGLAGLLISVVGSIAGLLLGIATMVARDIFHGVLGVSDSRSLLWINRTTIVVVAFCAMLTALANLQSFVLSWNYLSMALRGAGVFLPLTLAVFLPGALKKKWAISSMVLSTLFAITGYSLLSLSVNPLYTGMAASLLIILIGSSFSWFVQRKQALE